jgi:PucR family transcriptional regulator, purine catabolism regulatory protein
MSAQTLTFKTLVRLSFAETVTWLSPPAEATMVVRWVVLNVTEIRPGYVLLLSGLALDSEVLWNLSSRGGCGLIIVGETILDAGAFPPGISVVAVPREFDLAELHRTLLTLLISQRTYMLERGLHIHNQLSHLAAEDDDLDKLTQALYDLSGRAVLLQDKRLEVLTEAPSSPLLSIWDDVLEYLESPDNLPDSLRDRKAAGKQMTILRQPFQDGLERLVTPINVGGVARGYLSFVDVENQLDSLDQLIIEQGALVYAVEMARAKAVRETEKRLKGDLLTAILQENITSRDAVLWVADIGLDDSQAHVALRFCWDSQKAPSMRRLETLINGELARQGAQAIIETMGTEIISIYQINPASGRPDAAIQLGNAVLALAIEKYPHAPIRCGVGLSAQDLNNWGSSFRQAGQALEMARRLAQNQVQYFRDLSVYRLLLQLENHPELQAFKQEILGSLLEYEGGGDLIPTLEAYFDHNANLSQAAEALFIHRNTLIYRLERIAEISGLDLDNTETRLAIQLALRIHRMTERG